MNILILTGRFGMGHYSVAEALQEEINLENKNVNIEIVDIVDYMFPKTNKHIYRSFNFIVSKYSSVYNMYCGFSYKKFNIPMKRFISKKISKLIEDKSIDLILSTLPFSSQVVSVYKEITGNRIPLYTYITDICSHEEWIAPYTDFYFVGDKESKNNLALKGVNPNIVIVSGIPVKKCFRSEEIIKEKDKDKFEILIMGGGFGLLPCVDDLLKKLSQNSNVHVTVITGKNDMLKEEIEAKYPGIEVVGYTNEVHYYMKRSDLLITKSGGITIFEAINSQTPLFIIKPFLKQEIGNAQFIDRENLGRVIWYDDTDLVKDILSFVENRQFIKIIKENMNKMKAQWSNSYPFDTIRDFESSIKILEELGIKPNYFRPPWGHFNLAIASELRKNNLSPVLWDVMAKDWSGSTSSQEILIKLSKKTSAGDIICLHDGRGKDEAPTKTIENLESMIPLWLSKEYSFETVDKYDRK